MMLMRGVGLCAIRSSMTPFLIQILAMGLTVSQLFSKPVEEFKTHLDPVADVQLSSKILKDGCGIFTAGMAGDSRLNIENLLTGMLATPDAAQSGNAKTSAKPGASSGLFRKIDFQGLLNAYKLFCKGDQSVANQINIGAVLNYYNGVFKNLKDVKTLQTLKLGEATTVVDSDGKPFTEMYGAANRRLVVPIGKIPSHVKQAFVSAEDQNFYKHKGVDLAGLFRAFASIAGGSSGRPQGGSTITQQVVKNLLVNDDLTIERKMREMVLAARLEKIMSKDQILELYLNYVFLGRASWGIEMAAKSYFGPQSTTSNLSIEQAALLATLPKGPTYFNPDRHPERSRDRRQYVLTRMMADCNCVSAELINGLQDKNTAIVKYESPLAKGGFFFLDAISKEAKAAAGLDLKTAATHNIRSTVNPGLQKATEHAVRDGLMEYEANSGRKVWTGSQGSIAKDVEQLKMTWQEVLPRVQPKLYDVQWTLATVLSTNRSQVGLPGGKILPLKAPATVMRQLRLYDLIFVDVTGKEGKQTATIKLPARVQGSAVVLENKTGRVLAISGGFSYASSPYNRALLALRQPGSTLKPFVYLSALQAGLQPNTLLPDLPPGPPLSRRWRPKNYDGRSNGLVTFRTAIESSINLATIQLAARLGVDDPFKGLRYVQAMLAKAGLYKAESTKPDFAEVLGSREVRLIDLAAAYATVANVGLRPTPYFVESISRDGQTVYANRKAPPTPVPGIDRVAYYQLKKMLEGTVARGTAVRLKKYEGVVAGKTGTSNDESDAWFICFTNDITVAVWVGYDDKKIHRNLGGGSTGGRVALPIAERILKASFEIYKPAEKLAGPPDEIRQQVTELPIDMKSGVVQNTGFMEVFRGRNISDVIDTRISLLPEGEEAFKVQELPPEQIEDAELVERPGMANDPRHNFSPASSEPRVIIESDSAPGSGRPEYRPGVDDSYVIWRDQPRKVDPNAVYTYERIFNPQRR